MLFDIFDSFRLPYVSMYRETAKNDYIKELEDENERLKNELKMKNSSVSEKSKDIQSLENRINNLFKKFSQPLDSNNYWKTLSETADKFFKDMEQSFKDMKNVIIDAKKQHDKQKSEKKVDDKTDKTDTTKSTVTTITASTTEKEREAEIQKEADELYGKDDSKQKDFFIKRKKALLLK